MEQIMGIPASPGVAVGSVIIYRPTRPTVPRHTIDPAQIDAEWQRLAVALHQAREQIADLRDAIARRTGADEAAIFDAHLLVLEDEELLGTARANITGQHLNAAAAFWDAMMVYRDALLSIDDEYLRARSADLEDIALRVLACLEGSARHPLTQLINPQIIMARDLFPSDTAGIDPALVLGLITELGGPTAHVAILARQLNIPAVVGATGVLAAYESASQASGSALVVALDGGTGAVLLAPDAPTAAQFEARRAAFFSRRAALATLSVQPGITPDGHAVELGANIGHPREAEQAAKSGAVGIGLLRTEFLFLDRPALPTEAEQTQAYQEAARHFPDGAVIIRTLDIGGDKQLPYLTLPHEDNPFLGMRGLRLCLAPEYRAIFATQLRALVRAACAGARIQIMFPMVNDRDELRAARVLLSQVAAELDGEGMLATERLASLPVGAMVETPAAATTTDLLADEADFFSIGTNDLTQYVLAVNRLNPAVARSYSPFAPAVLRSIYTAINGAHQRGRKIGMCGELAGDPRATPLLLALGLDEFSMAPGSLPEVKQVIRHCTLARARDIMQLVYRLSSAEEIAEVLGASVTAMLAEVSL